jgi:anti-anti-sigma regulatory factor
MTIRITQEMDMRKGSATLHLEGSLNADDALMIEHYCEELSGQSIGDITLDLEGLTFLDGESGAALRRLRQTRGVSLIGCRLFTQEVIEGCHALDS